MTGNSDLRERLGAVFFAFIMVTSMVAVGMAGFAGSAAADATTSATTVDAGSDGAISPGENVTYDNLTVGNPSGASQDLNLTKIAIYNTSSLGANNISKVTISNNSTGEVLGQNTSINSIGTDTTDAIIVPINGSQGLNISAGQSLNYSAAVEFNSTSIENDTDVELNFESFNSTSSSFASDGSGFINTASATTSLNTTLVGTSADGGSSTTDDERANINVSFTTPANSANGVNESSIDLTVDTRDDGTNGTDSVQVISGGEIVNGTDNGTNFDSNGNVTIDVDVPLPDSDDDEYDIRLDSAVTDDGGNVITASGKLADNIGTVDMEPTDLVTQADNPVFANLDGDQASSDENATVQVYAVDKFGNAISDSTEVNATVTLSPNDDSVTVTNVSSSTNGVGNESKPYNFSVSNTEIEDVSLTAYDTFSDDSPLNSNSATQTFTGTVDDVAVTFNRSNAPADDTTRVQATAQLVDANSDPVPKENINVAFSFDNGTPAGVNVRDGSQTQQTNTDGNATLNFTVANSGVTLDISAIEQANNNAGSNTIQTVPGQVSSTKSVFRVNDAAIAGPGDDIDDVKVATDHDLSVEVLDDSSNAIPDQPVSYTLNGTEVATATSDSNGFANATVTLPEQKGDYVLNASAGAFNASATSDAQVNVTAAAENTSTLQFGTAPTSIAPESQDNQYTIEAADEFGNVNTSTSSLNDVTLTSDDTGVLDFDGSESDSQSLSSGSVSFNVDANGTGTATLSATIPDTNISNDTLDVTVAEPSALVLTPAHNVVTSGTSGQNQAALEAQFVDADGDALGINNQNITFAKQSGSAAEVDQSLADTTEKTDGDGNVSIDVNGTSDTGETTFIALAENYSVQGTATVTTTGPADSISVTPESDSVATNNSINVTAEFVDTEGRNVPLTSGSIQLSPASGSIEGSSTQGVAVNSDGQVTATFTYNASDVSAGTVTLTAIGSGVSGTADVTVTGAASERPAGLPDAVSTESFSAVDSDGDGNLAPSEIALAINENAEQGNVNGRQVAPSEFALMINFNAEQADA